MANRLAKFVRALAGASEEEAAPGAEGAGAAAARQFLAAVAKGPRTGFDPDWNAERVKKLPAFQQLLKLEPEARREALLVILENPPQRPLPMFWGGGAIQALARGLAWRPEDVRRLLGVRPAGMTSWPEESLRGLILGALESARPAYAGKEYDTAWRRAATRVLKDVGDRTGAFLARLLADCEGEPERLEHLAERLDALPIAGAQARAVLGSFPGEPGRALLALLADSGGSEPTQRWTQAARRWVDSPDPEALDRVLRRVAEEGVQHTPTEELYARAAAAGETVRVYFEQEARRAGATGLFSLAPGADALAHDFARAATWLRGVLNVPGTVPSLTDDCLKFSRSDADSLANAAAVALSLTGAPEGLAALQALKQKVKHKGVRKALDKALERYAKGEGQDAETLQDRSVESFGLDAAASRRWTVGDCDVLLQVTPRGKVTVTWTREGHAGATPPKALQESHPAEARQVRDTAKAIGGALSLQKARLEEAMVSGRRWTPEAWEAAFRSHPLLSHLARRLVWGGYDGDRLVATLLPAAEGWTDASGAPAVPEGTRLGVAHPLELPSAALEAWQRRLVRDGVVQPFKQAFRETYVLTPAEEVTRDHSNRFATHVVRAGQLYALAKGRGWSGLSAMHETQYEGFRDLKPWNVRAWLVLGAPEDLEWRPGEEILVTLDQVCFTRPRRHYADGKLPLAQVPPLAFSEAMRDVDLFVGVGSLGAAEVWEEGGRASEVREADRARMEARRGRWEAERGRYEELQASRARTRGAMLRELAPVLGLQGRVAVDGHFAYVEGTRARYRVHLGSGNIHLEPSGTYLCIVPRRSQTEKIHLPFEEEDFKTAEVLSKVLLLAEDASIKDRSILAQLPGARRY